MANNAQAAAGSQDSFRLMGLALEVRELIYTFFVASCPYTITSRVPSHLNCTLCGDALREHRRDIHSLLLANHQVHDEVLKILPKAATFAMSGYILPPTHQLLHESRFQLLPLMQHLEVEVNDYHDISNLTRVLSEIKCGNLKDVVVKYKKTGFWEDIVNHIRMIDRLNAESEDFVYSWACVGPRIGVCDSQCKWFSKETGHPADCPRFRSDFDWDLRRLCRVTGAPIERRSLAEVKAWFQAPSTWRA